MLAPLLDSLAGLDITTLIASLLTYHYRHKCSGSTFRVAGAAASVAVLTLTVNWSDAEYLLVGSWDSPGTERLLSGSKSEKWAGMELWGRSPYAGLENRMMLP